MPGTPGTSDTLAPALRQLAATARLLVALDFDGTLAPTVDQPERAEALPEAAQAVVTLAAAPGTRVAYLSGRALDSLTRVARPPDNALLVGSHGVEFRWDGGAPTPVELDPSERRLLDEVFRVLTTVAQGTDSVWVERKPAGFALHTRLATPAGAQIAQAAAREGTSRLSGLTVRAGKDVVEFSVRSASKGEALRRLRSYTHASNVFFAGDDRTDEDGFAVLGAGDVGVKVGAGPTAAAFRVADPAELARVLEQLAGLRGCGR